MSITDKQYNVRDDNSYNDDCDCKCHISKVKSHEVRDICGQIFNNPCCSCGQLKMRNSEGKWSSVAFKSDIEELRNETLNSIKFQKIETDANLLREISILNNKINELTNHIEKLEPITNGFKDIVERMKVINNDYKEPKTKKYYVNIYKHETHGLFMGKIRTTLKEAEEGYEPMYIGKNELIKTIEFVLDDLPELE